MKSEAERLSRRLKRGEVSIASIDLFHPVVLFLAPIVDSYLTETCRNANDQMLNTAKISNQGRYLPNSWVLHRAVAIKNGSGRPLKLPEAVKGVHALPCGD